MAGKSRGAKKVLVVDDHPVVRKGLCLLINEDSKLQVCGEAGDMQEALDQLDSSEPDIILTDISLKGSNGIELIKAVRKFNANVPILAFSIHDEELYAERVLSAGASGYVMKQEDPDYLLKAIHKVLAGEIFVSTAMATRLLKQMSGRSQPGSGNVLEGIEKLSDRELEVFELIGQGISSRRIAEMLNLSIKTIETYRGHIKEKFGLADAAELTHHAVYWAELEKTGKV